MQVDVFTQIIVPVLGGLGIFMLGLEFMSNGIQAVAVNRMRALLATFAGTPVKGVLAGTFITGIIQSSTAMTVMTVGLVNAGVVGLRPAISVIMGANIGTTLGNGLIALPLGPLGLLLAGVFALVHIFAKSEKTKNIALACMGFALIFYGLNLMTGGLRPLRGMPEVMSAISSLQAENFGGLLVCVATAALVTAMIHSSSATIGIVMGLGSAGILDWQTAVAFSLGADLGTTITSWLASLNLSKNAKRAAYAHISFNIIGVCVTIPLFFLSMEVLRFAMQWFGGDPSVPVMVNGKETYPLVPVAIGLYSTVFNIFNVLLLFPFIGVFERVLRRIGHDSSEDIEDYSMPRYLTADRRGDLAAGVPALQKEIARHLEASTLFLAMASAAPHAPKDPGAHRMAISILSRNIGTFAATLLKPNQSYPQADLVASLVEEADFAESLGETLHQVALRVKEEDFSPQGRELVSGLVGRLDEAMRALQPGSSQPVEADRRVEALATLRRTCLTHEGLSPRERGTLLGLLGSAERAFLLIERLDGERRSVDRSGVLSQMPVGDTAPDLDPRPALA
ncbi:Na/Pi cotransporter family protein [Azospirillum sp. YIM B02556]|uniref:Na/Pi cotransporter family protein n=1 Tax=Azospirillum endophyticum TaxID=2800326 RepID=A0ABS1F192_9PROT|nr:Na/Pi symporter [Azospirillum endophyticum]MBK1837185.1 Na/Pi cotransporter family protein [Azospirillum endophyticum]